MKIILSIIFMIAIFPQCSFSADDECLNCHSVLGDKLQKASDLYVNDVHYLKGITCAGCHGGDALSDDPEISMSKQKGFIGVPARKERYLLCVNCHADQQKMNGYGFTKNITQYDELKSSVHFKQTYNNQGPVADCITCHSVHNIVKVNNSASPVHPLKVVQLCGSCHSDAGYMKNYNASLPVDQVAKYKTSVHGKRNVSGDSNAAECVSCHGSHEIRAVNDPHSFVYPANIPAVCSNCHSDKNKMQKYNIPTEQYASYKKSVHGIALLEKGDLGAPACNDCHGNHGATPPGVESISKVCGSCHALNMELFETSVHKPAFDKEGIPECESCHGNHNIAKVTDDLLGVNNNSTCIKCHKSGEKGYIAANFMRHSIDSLKQEEASAKNILTEAERKGMDVSDAQFALKDIRQVLIQSRTTVHAFNTDEFSKVLNGGFEITQSARTQGLNAVDEYYFRRKGLIVSTLIVTMLCIGLFLKIKRIEKQDKIDS